MLDTKYINDLKNEFKINNANNLTKKDRQMLAMDLFANNSQTVKLSALEPRNKSQEIIELLQLYTSEFSTDDLKSFIALRIAESLVNNIENYFSEDIEEFFL